jgi:lipopolysaccharide transport system ATP-binding protein
MENAISVKNLKKKFRLYHEKRDTVYEAIGGFFQRKKYYEDLIVLDDISFDVKKGEMFGIVGKNGTGKTTLLKILSKIYQPDSGTVEINGVVVPFLGLGAGFNGEMTARDNVILYGKLLGLSKKTIENKIPDIIEFAELKRFEDIKLKNFSAGMYARLAFATAVQVEPDIILMDEILSVGDIGFQKKSYKTFLDFKERKKTIVLVTHDLDVVANTCDKAMFLNNGKIISIGKPDIVIEDYKKLFN